MSKIKSELLGENFSTAAGKLRKMIMFSLIQKLELDVCYRCTLKIDTLRELSIEHTESWQSAVNPVETFYDLDKIAFSHLNCNISAAAKPWKKYDTKEDSRRARHLRYYAENKTAVLKRKKDMRNAGKWK